MIPKACGKCYPPSRAPFSAHRALPSPEPSVQLCRQYEGGLLKVYGWQGNGKEVKSKDMQKSPPKPQSHPKTLLIVVR